MLSANTYRHLRMLAELVFLALITLVLVGLLSAAQAQTPAGRGTQRPQPAQPAPPAPQDAPVLRDYRGVSIGTATAEVRRRLGQPTEAADRQDFYAFSDKESAQVFYDTQGAVRGVLINYLGEGSNAPTPEQVFGAAVQPNPDGSVYHLVRYASAGYSVVYTRTAGDQPLVTVAMQRLSN